MFKVLTCFHLGVFGLVRPLLKLSLVMAMLGINVAGLLRITNKNDLWVIYPALTGATNLSEGSGKCQSNTHGEEATSVQ